MRTDGFEAFADVIRTGGEVVRSRAPSLPAGLFTKGHAEDKTDSNSTGRRLTCALML